MPCALAAWCQTKMKRGPMKHFTIYIFSIPVSLVGISCHVLWGPGVETTRWTGDKISSQCTSRHSRVIGSDRAHVMCSGRIGVETTRWTGIKTSSHCTFSPFLGHWLGAHVMCSGGLVSKPQGEPGAKPAHNAHFLHSCVIGWELMSCVLWVVVSKPQGEPGTKPAHNLQFSLFPRD